MQPNKKTEELSEKLRQSDSALREITDEVLKKRIGTLLKSPLDTMIREAGVVLEDRLRAIGEAGSDLEGVKLVDALLNPEKGKLVFSSHPGEQDGVRMLYRGAMQFIRNPPMHKLVEYPENTARLLIRLVDSFFNCCQKPNYGSRIKTYELQTWGQRLTGAWSRRASHATLVTHYLPVCHFG